MLEEIIKDDGVYAKFEGGVNKHLGRGYTLPAGEDRSVSMFPITIPVSDGSKAYAVKFVNKDKPTHMILSEQCLRSMFAIFGELQLDEYEKKKNDSEQINKDGRTD